jgi:peptidoglycan/xylan/chitin deacetylase (PgdA/CDA1 family)
MRAILLFHGVDASGSVLSVTAEQLRSLLGHVARSGHRVVSLRELLEGLPEPNRIALTFDDGFTSVARGAAPVLAELGMPATLFLTTGFLGKDNRWPSQPAGAPVQPMLGWDDVAQLARAGWDIQAHTVNHPDLRQLGDVQIGVELDQCCAQIEQRLGTRPDVFAYPYGYLDGRVAAVVRTRFRHAVTTTFDTLARTRPAHLRPRIDAYYLREPAVHRHFGTRRFDAYLALRGAGRRLKGHPGETG